MNSKRDIFEVILLRGVLHNSESDSAVCIIPQSQAPQCASHRGVKRPQFLIKLCGVHHTAESSSAVCIIPRSQAPWCASLRGVHPTMESSSPVCIILQSQALRCASHLGVKMHTAESKSKSLRVSGCF